MQMQMAQAIDHWLEQNQNDLVMCPHQPGNLMISKKACAKRYLTAQRQANKEQRRRQRSKTVFEEAVDNGLMRCLDCPVGRELSALESDL